MEERLRLLVGEVSGRVERGEAVNLLSLQRQFAKRHQMKQPFFKKAEILAAARAVGAKEEVLQVLQVKPIRTQAGVATVTVLTKPWVCPGQCVFCPADLRMPKSYLANEPGAARAEANYLDPYLQVMSRLRTLVAMGHNLEKVELIILGGSWESYPLPYRLFFMREVFRALNDFGGGRDGSKRRVIVYQRLEAVGRKRISNQASVNEQTWRAEQAQIKRGEVSYNQVVEQFYLRGEREQILAKWQRATWDELGQEQQQNEKSKCRCVGLVIETRPDLVTRESLLINRRFGCTKIQIGVQSLSDKILRLNDRRMRVRQVAQAFGLLREYGYKIHAHLMANLVGADLKSDLASYRKLVSDERFIPDEIKLYPCSLLESARLVDYYHAGRWRPYGEAELLTLLTKCVWETPEYIRITRMIRDFSAKDIVAGNKKTNFRQLVAAELERRQLAGKTREIRAREVRAGRVELENLRLLTSSYQTRVSQEKFLQWVTDKGKIVGFLRLSLPNNLKAAMIREVHVYGVVSSLGEKSNTQHLGLGKKLVAVAEQIAKEQGFRKLRVISAVGTREYYRKLGFATGSLYQFKKI